MGLNAKMIRSLDFNVYTESWNKKVLYVATVGLNLRNSKNGNILISKLRYRIGKAPNRESAINRMNEWLYSNNPYNLKQKCVVEHYENGQIVSDYVAPKKRK